ncbi:GRAM domain-containing protein 2A-like isoform X6 [Passer domesticus]|uniref:GRAM domain-containing protein 2A-like isoform X6 n=1 Tax=Passer domesticus TaxID=48849 RepID=UPI0030FE3EF6
MRPDRPHNVPPLPRLSHPSLMPGKLRRSRREVLGEKQWRSLEERGGAQLEQPKLTRSRTYEPPCRETEQAATGRQGPPSPSAGVEQGAAGCSRPPAPTPDLQQLSKQDSSYRRAFGELAEQDVLLGCFSCAWQREMPYHGRLYVSSRHICFHSNLLLKDIKAVVPVASISALKKTNTALLVPNAISIRTAKGEKFLFVSLRQREATYQLLRSVCKHLQVRGVWMWRRLHPSIARHLPSSLLVQGSGQSPRDSVRYEQTLGKSQMSQSRDQGRQRMRMARWPAWFPAAANGCPQQRDVVSGGDPTPCSGPGPLHFGPG